MVCWMADCSLEIANYSFGLNLPPALILGPIESFETISNWRLNVKIIPGGAQLSPWLRAELTKPSSSKGSGKAPGKRLRAIEHFVSSTTLRQPKTVVLPAVHNMASHPTLDFDH